MDARKLAKIINKSSLCIITWQVQGPTTQMQVTNITSIDEFSAPINSLSAIRVLRVFRLFRLVKIIRGMRVVFNTFVSALRNLADVAAVLSFFCLVFAILGKKICTFFILL